MRGRIIDAVKSALAAGIMLAIVVLTLWRLVD